MFSPCKNYCSKKTNNTHSPKRQKTNKDRSNRPGMFLVKRCSENCNKFTGEPMPKCDFNRIVKQLY